MKTNENKNKKLVTSLLKSADYENLKDSRVREVIEALLGGRKDIDTDDSGKLSHYAFLIYTYILNSDTSVDEQEKLANEAYRLLSSVDISRDGFKESFGSTWAIDGVNTELQFYFYTAVLGLIADETIKARLLLSNFEFDEGKLEKQQWDVQVINSIMAALVYLIRKRDGLEDVAKAGQLISRLQSKQAQFEQNYLAEQKHNGELSSALKLLGLYHTSKLVVETSNYLSNGYNYKGSYAKIIRQHTEAAKQSFKLDPGFINFASTVSRACSKLKTNSIWHNTENLGTRIEKLCKSLADHQIIDLLPSQQEALGANVLDPASNVVVLQMPTSAGKSLLAEFSILQTLSLNESARIVYIVPTRALTNQVLFQLRQDFEGLEINVEQTSKVNEIDPTEAEFLDDDIDVLVTTPEKLDLLIRQDHPVTSNIAMVVVDEAHNIGDESRGARLELLLAIVKRERPKARFLLLSPFMPNSQILVDWLSNGKRSIPPIKVDWRPADKLIVSLKESRKRFSFEILPSSHGIGAELKEGLIKVEDAREIKSVAKKQRLMEFTYKHLSNSGSNVLYLCQGKKSADKKARLMASVDDSKPAKSELIDLAIRYIEDEVGEATALTEVLPKRIAVHHAGLTNDTKLLVEHLIKKNEIKHIFATTTVAQGLNFPISTVYFDDLRKGNNGLLTSNEFLNIAGRAGRTMVDSVGRIIFPNNSKDNYDKARALVKQEAIEITSALLQILLQIGSTIKNQNIPDDQFIGHVVRHSNDAINALIQYIVHLVNVAGDTYLPEDLEDLFKDSLGYFTLPDSEKDSFMALCRRLYSSISRQDRGVLKLADRTGFSVPSVLSIMQDKSKEGNLADPRGWNPEYLFNPDLPYLKEKIDVIAYLREVDLGTESKLNTLNTEVIAKVLSGWVNGSKISDLSKIHPFFMQKKDDERINDFVKYLTESTFKASWGMSALEGIVRTGEELPTGIPSMIYYGVKKPDAVIARMVGVPRGVADGIANYVIKEDRPKSYNEVRRRVRSLSSSDWANIVPKGSKLNGEEWKQITNMLLS